MPADVGTLGLVGRDAPASRTGVAGVGAVALAGAAASLTVRTGAGLPADGGLFDFSGAAAPLTLRRRLAAEVGGFSLVSPGAAAARTAASMLGPVALAAADADLRAGRRLTAGAALITAGGAAAPGARSGAADAGALSLVGAAAGSARAGASAPCSLALAGSAAALTYAQGVDADPGALVLSGAAGLLVRLGFQAAPGAVLVSGEAVLRLYRRQVILRPDAGRMPFGGRERGGAGGGELHPDGPGPMLEGYRQRSDVARLPWECPRGSEWTTPELRAAVLRWLSQLIARRRTSWGLSGKWSVVERAQARGLGVRRLPPDQHHLVITLRRTRSGPLEVALPFPRGEREGAALTARLALAEGSFAAIL